MQTTWLNKTTLALLFCIASTAASADTQRTGWYLKPTLGFGSLSDQTGTFSNAENLDGNAEVSLSGGIHAGLGWGYRYDSPWRAELYWEYRSNDSDTTLAGTGDTFSGNYASSTFYLNGYYHFFEDDIWSFYAGAGLGYVQEIDLDLEQNGVERSYSGDGDILPQIILGADYNLSEKWSASAEFRYATLSSVDLDGEENAVGTLTGLDYNPLSLTLGVTYRF